MSTITRLRLSNLTAFGQFDHSFVPGITVITGANGTGKTHLLKLLYAACAITSGDDRQLTYAQKIISVFRPFEGRIGRLSKRQARSVNASVVVEGNGGKSLSVKFSNHTRDALSATTVGQVRWKTSQINAAYIPVKEMLAHAPGFISTAAKRELEFESTYTDILKLAYLPILKGPMGRDRAGLLEALQKAISGKVVTKGEHFFLKNRQGDLEFSLLAEGMRKLALIWLLIQNGTLLAGSILFWDEPEANLNPALMEQLVEVILQLQRNGVQIILATHNHILMRYLELKREKRDSLQFLNLRRDNDEVKFECADSMSGLIHLAIKDSVSRLYDAEVRSAIDLGL